MKTFTEFLNENVTITGSLVHNGMMEGFVKLFYNTLSKVSKAYKKQSDPSLYMMNGCGEVFDANTTQKIVDRKPFYKLSNQIVTHYGKVFYTLEMDVDSSNVVSMYRDYADRSKVEKYQAVMSAKKNIMETLKAAGFSVRSDRASIYASITNYVKNPTDENGLVVMNYHQRELLKVAKKFFSYDGVQPAYNMYALTLKQARLLKDLNDENELEKIMAGNTYAKVVLTTNGKIEFYRFEGDEYAEKTLIGCFEPIQKDYDLED